MQPPRLIFPETLAVNWIETLERDGFRIQPAGRPLSGSILYRGARYDLHLEDAGRGIFRCDLSKISDKRLYKRLEQIFISSGARFNLSEFVSSSFNALYRCDFNLMHHFWQSFREEGIKVEISEKPPFGGESFRDYQLFVTGKLRRHRNLIEVETGPSYDSSKSIPTAFIDLIPKFRLYMRESLRSFMDEVRIKLETLGAQPILVFGSFQAD